jgi:hypothetical protein
MANSKLYTENCFQFPPTKAPCFGAPEKPLDSPPSPAKQRGRPRKHSKPDNYKTLWPKGVWDITNPDWTEVWRAWRAFIIAEKRRANVTKARQAKLKTQKTPNRASESLSDRALYLYHEYRFGEVGATHRQAVTLIAARLRQDEKTILNLINGLRTE